MKGAQWSSLLVWVGKYLGSHHKLHPAGAEYELNDGWPRNMAAHSGFPYLPIWFRLCGRFSFKIQASELITSLQLVKKKKKRCGNYMIYHHGTEGNFQQITVWMFLAKLNAEAWGLDIKKKGTCTVSYNLFWENKGQGTAGTGWKEKKNPKMAMINRLHRLQSLRSRSIGTLSQEPNLWLGLAPKTASSAISAHLQLRAESI